MTTIADFEARFRRCERLTVASQRRADETSEPTRRSTRITRSKDQLQRTGRSPNLKETDSRALYPATTFASLMQPEVNFTAKRCSGTRGRRDAPD